MSSRFIHVVNDTLFSFYDDCCMILMFTVFYLPIFFDRQVGRFCILAPESLAAGARGACVLLRYSVHSS